MERPGAAAHERANLERETTAEFIEHEQRLTDFAKGPIGISGSAKQHRETGLCEPHDELARRIGTELAGRKEASALSTWWAVALIGRKSARGSWKPRGSTPWSRQSRDRAVSDLRPGLGLAIQALQFQMGGTDPETDQYKRLAAEIATLEARINAAGPIVENLQRQAAVALLDRVKAGELDAILKLRASSAAFRRCDPSRATQRSRGTRFN